MQRFRQLLLAEGDPFSDPGQMVLPGEFGQDDEDQNGHERVADPAGMAGVVQAGEKLIQASDINEESFRIHIDIERGRTILLQDLPRLSSAFSERLV